MHAKTDNSCMFILIPAGSSGSGGGAGNGASGVDEAAFIAQIEELRSLVCFYEMKVSSMAEAHARGPSGGEIKRESLALVLEEDVCHSRGTHKARLWRRGRDGAGFAVSKL